MENITEIRLDISKVTHIKIKNSFKGIDNGWVVRQYKYCEAMYTKFLWWRFLKAEAGYWRNGIQYSSCLSSMYEREEIYKNPMYAVHDGWVYTNVSLEVYVSEKVIKELFFTDLEIAKRYCDINFHNVNFII